MSAAVLIWFLLLPSCATIKPPSKTAMERPSIFVNPNGRPILFFLETSVRDRFKLLRLVGQRNVVTEALEADILIAEGGSKEIKDFLQAWGNDKVILDAGWIYKCIQAKRYIGEDESWGGCDLRSLKLGCDTDEEQREDEDQGEEQPREASQLRRQTKSAGGLPPSVTASQSHHYQTSQSPKIKISDSPPPTKKRRLGEPSNPVFSEAPYDTNVLQTFQQGASTQAHPYTAGPSTSALPQITSALGHVLSSPQLLLNTLHTAMVQHLIHEGVLSSEIGAQFGNIGSTSMPSSSTQQQQHRQTPLSTQSDGINSFTSRSDTTAPTPASPKYEEEGESTVIVQKYPRRTGSLSSMPSPNNETRRTSGTGLESTEKAPAAQLTKGFFFLDGAPSNFYIDMSVKNRKELINIVKKNGGKIVSVMSDADFIVLDNRSASFSRIAATVPFGKTVVLPKWLTECAQKLYLVPVEPYRIETSSRSASSSPSKRQKVPSSSQKTPVSSQKHEGKQPVASTSKLALHSKVKQSPQRIRSPSPPAHIEALSDTKYAFTQGEKEWFIRYIRFQWRQDPKISVNALMNAITRKAPHHPKSSWQNAFHVKWAAEVQALKNEMNIF